MIIAVYSAKGGVGKTTLAVNLAWASATLSHYSTLLWDLDPQGGASYILRQEPAGNEVRRSIADNKDMQSLAKPSGYDKLDIVAADPSLRHLDRDFHALGKRRRLAKVTSALAAHYDCVIIDCPPGLTDTSDQIMRAADLVVVPLIPAVLSQRSLDAIKEHLDHKDAPKVVLAPVFCMVDRRRQLHRSAIEDHPSWPVILMASAYERVSQERAPIGELLPRGSAPVGAVAELWKRLDTALSH